MSRENITKAFQFGARVKFNRSIVVHPNSKDKEYCLIGFCDNAYALIEWEKRGQYHFEYYTGSVYADLELSV